jgi:hypothetical protein
LDRSNQSKALHGLFDDVSFMSLSSSLLIHVSLTLALFFFSLSHFLDYLRKDTKNPVMSVSILVSNAFRISKSFKTEKEPA